MNDNHDGAAKKAAHTPAPWRWTEHGLVGPNTEFPGGKFIIAVTEHDGAPASNDWRYAVVEPANKPLIAAAPDLFAALEAIVYYHDEGMHEVAQGHLMNARAAIAKACRLVADACEGCQRTDVGTRLSADDVRLCEACFAECAAATKTRGEVQP